MWPKACSVILTLMCVWRASTQQTYSLQLTREPGSNNIVLKCRNSLTFQTQATARFWRKVQLSDDGDDNAQLLYVGHEYHFTLTPAMEGYFCCGIDNISSAGCRTTPLLAYPVLDPDTRDFYFIKADTPFTSLDCGITLGAMSTFYTRQWHKALTLLTSHDSSERVRVEQDFSLTVQNATLSDGGEYTCYVGVESNSASHCITVLVYDLKVDPSDRKAVAVQPDEHKSTTFTCSFSAQTSLEALETLSLEWRHNGMSLSSTEGKYNVSTDNHQIILSSGNVKLNASSSLTVYNLQLLDSGEYSCSVEVSVVTAESRKEETARITNSLQLLAITNEMGLQVTRFLGGHIQLCITNIPVVVPDLKGAGFKIRLTNTEVSGGSTSFQEWITNHSLLVGTDRLCYHYLYEDILDLGLYRSAKVQVALLFDGVIGPLIPSMDMAEVIKTSTVTEPSTTSPLNDDDEDATTVTVVVCATVSITAFILLVGLMILGVLYYRTYLRRRYNKSIMEMQSKHQTKGMDKPELNTEYKAHSPLRGDSLRLEESGGAERDARAKGAVDGDGCDTLYSLVTGGHSTTV